MSGAGKSTLLTELSRRGHLTVNTDDDGWVLDNLDWDEPRMTRLLEDHRDIVVSGTVSNQGRFTFDHIVLISAPLDVLLARVADRTTNSYGKTPAQQAEIRRYTAEVMPLLRHSADVELDGQKPVAELADVVEELLRAAR
jgi:adenylate kinase family enzyme